MTVPFIIILSVLAVTVTARFLTTRGEPDKSYDQPPASVLGGLRLPTGVGWEEVLEECKRRISVSYANFLWGSDRARGWEGLARARLRRELLTGEYSDFHAQWLPRQLDERDRRLVVAQVEQRLRAYWATAAEQLAALDQVGWEILAALHGLNPAAFQPEDVEDACRVRACRLLSLSEESPWHVVFECMRFRPSRTWEATLPSLQKADRFVLFGEQDGHEVHFRVTALLEERVGAAYGEWRTAKLRAAARRRGAPRWRTMVDAIFSVGA